MTRAADSTATCAAAEMLADLLRERLLAGYLGVLTPRHRVTMGRLVGDEAATAMLEALEAFGDVVTEGGSREAALEAFVDALGPREPAAPPADATPDGAAHEAHAREVGPEAALLERMADERDAFASDAAGLDPAEEALARSDASRLRSLARRHAIHFLGRDVRARFPYVEEDPAPPDEPGGGNG